MSISRLSLGDVEAAIVKAGSDGECFGHPVGPYRTLQKASELAALIVALSERSKPVESFLEIGSAGGGTCRLITELLDIKTVRIMDMGDHRAHAAVFQDNMDALTERGVDVRVRIGSSHEDSAWNDWLDIRPDLILVDGDHTWEGCREDVRRSMKAVADNGVIAVHDTGGGDPGVLRWVMESVHGVFSRLYEIGRAEHGGPGMRWYTVV